MRRMERDLWTADQVAKRLGVSLAAVRRWTYQRRLASLRIGRCCRYDPAQVERFVRERPALRPAGGQGYEDAESS